jgi:CrcB protein
VSLPPRVIAAVALGGAAGAVARPLLELAFPYGGGFPWTTFTINLVGAALLAGLELLPLARRSRTWAAGLGPGLLGGFTTLSLASEETRSLLAGGDVVTATVYFVGMAAACLIAVTLVARFSPPLPEEDEL